MNDAPHTPPSAPGQATPDCARLSAEPLPERDDWREQVVHVEGPFVWPEQVTVEGAAAEVENPDALCGEGGSATIIRAGGERSVTLVLDLGRIAMGEVEIGVAAGAAAGGAPIRASYAQFRQFLGPDGDGMGAPFGTDAHPWSRVDIFEPSDGPQVLSSPTKREMRYIALTLDGPGEVEIEFVRVRQAIYQVDYDGHFLCSDDLLNRAWYNSAYTGDLSTVSEESSLPGAPEGPSPWMLTVTYDRVLFMCDLHLQAIAGYYQSSDYRHLVRNTLHTFGSIQNPDGSFPAASSHLVKLKDDPGPADGWNCPEDGPDPDEALGFVGSYSIYRDFKLDNLTAFWVAGLADYYLYTGDADFVRMLLPVARRAVGFLSERTTEQGLYYEPEDKRVNPEAEIPWVANWSPGDLASGVDSFSNAVFDNALRGLATLEEEIAEDPGAAQSLREQADRLREALIAHLWDEGAGAMVLNDADPLRDHSGDANAGNLMLETLDEQRASQAMAFLATTLAKSHGTTSSEFEEEETETEEEASADIVVGFKHHARYRAPDMQGFINAMEALGRMRYGDGEGAVDLIRRWWGHMLDNGPGTGWFAWRNDGSVGRDAFSNTAWTTALPALSEGILGIRPTAAGYRRWQVAPRLAGLGWAQGRVPVPGGSIASRWRCDGNSLVLSVESPEEGEGSVAVPLLGEPREIAMDGEVVWRDGAPGEGTDARQVGDAVVFSGLRGDHTFAWAKAA